LVAVTFIRVFGILDAAGLARPIICTPEELLGDD